MPQGNQSVPQNPCDSAGNAPSPQQYAAQGQSLQQLVNTLQQTAALPSTTKSFPYASISALIASSFLDFRRGSSLDAQAYNTPCGAGCVAYGNYAFGVFSAASGLSLPETLDYADGYAFLRSSYPPTTDYSPNYQSLPSANVANITAGYNAQMNGSLCHK
jgi:hypothetical protein